MIDAAMTRRPPLVFRLMLCTLFLPIMIALGVLLYFLWFHAPEVWTQQTIILGLPSLHVAAAFYGLPFLLWLWMLWSGNWRRPVLFAGIVYFVAFILAAFEIVREHTPPEKREIDLTIMEGIDVYCNGVHLGTTPFRIRVDELQARVPEWNTPPEQPWYSDEYPLEMLFTWFPWDDFREERFNASKELFGANTTQLVSHVPRAVKAKRETLAKHDAGCRYWWSFRQGDSTMGFYRKNNPYYLNTPFDRVRGYFIAASISPFSPSAVYHAQLLADVLPELSPEEKTDWDRHVLKHWPLLSRPLSKAMILGPGRRNHDENDPLVKLYRTALDSTARLKYGLSDPPTEEECRRVLEQWVDESAKDRLFQFSNTYSSGALNGSPADLYVVNSDFDLIESVIRQMGETVRVPLAEQWKKNRFRYENGWAPLAYLAWTEKSPGYFDDFARYSATSNNGRIPLLGNDDPRAAALFRTLLHRRGLSTWLTPRFLCYATPIEIFAGVGNPRTEADFREYVVTALSDPDHNDTSRELLNRAVFNAIYYYRIRNKNIDKGELAQWVSSLSLNPPTKNLALRLIRIHDIEVKTFADRLQQAAGQQALIETELTLDEVTKWFAEHPDQGLFRFLADHEESITVSGVFQHENLSFSTALLSTSMSSTSTVNTTVAVTWNDKDEVYQYAMWNELPSCFVLALLRSDTPEGDPKIRATIRQIWKQDQDRAYIEQAIEREYGTINPVHFAESDTGSVNLPDYIFDLCESVELKPIVPWHYPLVTTLALCDSARAGELLEKWHAEASESNKKQLERCLEIWRTRNELHRGKMKLFRDLVADRMKPDDLLLRQAPWVWKDGRYVQSQK